MKKEDKRGEGRGQRAELGFLGSVGFRVFFWLADFVRLVGFGFVLWGFFGVGFFFLGGGGGWVLNFCLSGGFLLGLLFWLCFCSANSC